MLRSSVDTLRAPDAAPDDPARELTTTFKYDDFSRLERIDYPTGAGSSVAVEYAFDAYGHTTQVRKASDPAQIYWELVEPEQGYRIKEERFGTHSCGASTGTRTTRAYDSSTGSLQSVQTKCGAQTLQDLSYEYDEAGNLTERVDGVASTFEEYEYDDLNRPTKRRTTPTGSYNPYYEYDAALGRLTSQAGVGTYTYSPDGRDWIATAGGNSYGRDSVGNITSRAGPSVPGGSQTIEYTTQNLPSSITTGSDETRFSYDASGRRVVKQTLGTLSGTPSVAGLALR